ncbi:MAG: hypothetical protein FWD08_07415 [Alphaproteobacteria bacterium]|nr:hypothetical protein [Alphaproteobacteria bacterium]
MRLDWALPQSVLSSLHHQTGVDRDRIVAMTIGAKPWRPLILPFRRDHDGPREKQVMWLQFCPAYLAEDEKPFKPFLDPQLRALHLAIFIGSFDRHHPFHRRRSVT